LSGKSIPRTAPAPLSSGTGALVVVAEITGAFGVRGEARVRSFTADPEACFAYGALMDRDRHILLTPVKVRPLKDAFAVTAKEARSREEWEALRGALLHVPREAMPAPKDDEVYVVDLIGLEVVHVDGRPLGRIRGVHNFGAGDLLDIQGEAGGFLLPFTRADVPAVDLTAGRVTAAPDEALIPQRLQRQSPDGGTN
jgi:16S rRNA processing protein RimM